MAGFSGLGTGVASKALSAIFGSPLDNGWDSRVTDYYNKNYQSIYDEATAGQTFDPVSGSLVGGKDLYATTIAHMQADPTTSALFDTPKAAVTPTAGGQTTAASTAAADAAAALKAANASADLQGENKNLTIAGGSADAAASTVDDSGKKKRNPTGLASSLGINI